MGVRIIIDSSSDYSLEEATAAGLDFLPMIITANGKEYQDGVDLTKDEFFEILTTSQELPKTSQISPYRFEEMFQSIVDAGDTAVCITLSSKLSGTYMSANVAREGFEDSIFIVDSLNACIGFRVLIERAIQLRAMNTFTASELAQRLDEEKKNIRLIALLDTLEYLKKGGRISATAALAGAVFSIKPVISVTDGEIAVLGKARGSKNGNNLLTELCKKEGIDFSMPISLAYSGTSDKLLQQYIADHEDLYKEHVDSLPIHNIGATIGTHIGPGSIALSFFKAM